MPSVLASALAGLILALPAAAQELTAGDRQLAVARIWSAARHQFAYWDRVQADWDSAFRATLAAAGPSQPDVLFLTRLERFVAILGHGGTRVHPGGRARERVARPPLHIAAVEGRPFIRDQAPNDELRVARLEPLAEIVAVQGLPAERWIADTVAGTVAAASPEERWDVAVGAMLEGPRGTALHLQLRLPGGAVRGLSVTRSMPLNARRPAPLRRPALEVDTLDGGIVWVRLNDFDDPDLARDFDRAFPDFARVSGLVLDVRRNADAATAAPGHEILARLVSRPFVTVQWRAPRWHALTAEVDWELGVPDTVPPRADRPIYTGPLAALAGLGTAGAAEDFLVAYRGAARGPVVGERTAGRGGRSVMVELPRGWRFEVCATRHAFADGAEFVGTGIAPEQRAPATVADLLEGRDAALARARDYLAERAVSGP